jgi:uncharacterized protein YqhQ
MSKPLTPPPFNYGGQAVIEGVMMRGSKALAVAVRNPQGEIVMHTEPLDRRIYGGRLARIPFLRGLTLLWDALGLGIKSLMYSADVAMVEEPADGAAAVAPSANGDGLAADDATPVTASQAGKPRASSAFEGPAKWGTVLFSLALSIGLFFLLPAFVAGLIEGWLGLENNRFAGNLFEGLLRLGLLVGYIGLIGRLPDVRRLFGYHGAEHKTINAYEAGAPLTPESVARFSLQHPRCGTAFLLTIVVISILFFSLLPPLSIPLRLLSRLALLPVVAGIGYELIRFTGKHQQNTIIRWLIKPNLALQRLTTREPDEGMLQVAIAALQQVLSFEREVAVAPAIRPEPSPTL